MDLSKQTHKNHIIQVFLLFICEKKFIQCNYLAYFLNVLPDKSKHISIETPSSPTHELT